MRIKGVEKDLLFMNKIGEGKSFEEANYEIEVDNGFQDNIKYDFRKLKKENRFLIKENSELKKRLNKFLIPKEILYEKKIIKKDASCSVKYLNRIINYIKENPKCIKTKIVNDCGIHNDLCSEGLLFLLRNKLIKEKFYQGVNVYYVE